MEDVHHAWRTSIWLIALIVASALPAAAQPRKLRQVDDAVKQQQAILDQLKPSVEQLKSSVDQLTKENNALRQTLAEIDWKPAPPQAWDALQNIGLAFVAAWAAVTIFRELPSRKAAAADVELQIRKGIDKEAKSLETAANTRMKGMAELLRQPCPQPTPPGSGKGTTS